MKHVLLLTPFFSPNIGGVETYLDDMCETLPKKGVRLSVVTYQPMARELKGPAIEKKEGLFIRRLPWFGRKGDFFHKLQRFPAVQFFYLVPGLFLYSCYFLWKNRDIEVIHAQGIVAAFIGKFLKVIFKTKLIVNIQAVYNQNLLSGIHNVVCRWILKSSDQVFIPAEVMRKQLITIYGIPNEKIFLFRYWLNSKLFFSKNKQKKSFTRWEGKFVVLFVGRLLKLKGIDTLFEIADKVPEDVLIAIIGDGTRRGEISERAKGFSNIEFVGPVPNNKLQEYYSSADLFIFPSLDVGAYGIVNMEAQACGLPVLSKKEDGLCEVVQGGGVLVEPTVENFVDAIKDLKNNPEKLKTLSANAEVFALQNFSDKNADMFVDSYRQ